MEEKQLNIDNITPEEEDNLQKIAYRRNGFKIHTGIFLLVNILLWVIWFFVFKEEGRFLKAILFVTIAWLIFFIGHYLIVYNWSKTYTEKMLKQLKKKRKKQLKQIEKLRLEIEDTEKQQNQHTTESQGLPSENSMEA